MAAITIAIGLVLMTMVSMGLLAVAIYAGCVFEEWIREE